MPNSVVIPNLGQYLGRDGFLPNSATANQALAVLNSKLATDVPLGLGPVFANLEQQQLNRYGHLYNVVGDTASTTQGDIAAVKADTASIRSTVDFTSSSAYLDELVAEVWAYSDIPAEGQDVADLLSQSAAGADYYTGSGLHRFMGSVNFLCNVGGYYQPPSDPLAVILNDAYEGARLPGESDLVFLTRIYPAYEWEVNHKGLHLVGATIADTELDFPRDFWYSPPAPTLAEIYALFNYVTSSGQTRNAIPDTMTMLTLIPIQWS